jgi:hypothetical protein
MDNPGVEIRNIELANESIIITYENDAVETLSNNVDTYKAFYETWLKENPPFISDTHKLIMRNIILASINNDEKCINELREMFSASPEIVRKFLTYMRRRLDILPEKKAAWHTVQ